MKTVIGIATNNREKYLKNTLKSLAGQADDILIYDNKKENIDYKANAKFISPPSSPVALVETK